jgi:hypothetical protein
MGEYTCSSLFNFVGKNKNIRNRGKHIWIINMYNLKEKTGLDMLKD